MPAPFASEQGKVEAEGWGEGPAPSRLRERVGARALRAYLVPQHESVPNFVSLLSTPVIGLSVMSVTPVSV